MARHPPEPLADFAHQLEDAAVVVCAGAAEEAVDPFLRQGLTAWSAPTAAPGIGVHPRGNARLREAGARERSPGLYVYLPEVNA